MKLKKLGVLISGSGSNLQAIIDRCAEGAINAEVAVVISSRKDAYGLVRAKEAGIANYWIDGKRFPESHSYNLEILRLLKEHEVDLVVMAGYMRLLGNEVLKAYPQAVINLHPALLPAFPGGNAIEEALEYGVRITGVTVHFADENYDTGPIIVQEFVPVHQDDTLETLSERIHKAEHLLLPRAVSLWVDGRLRVEGRKVYIGGRVTGSG